MIEDPNQPEPEMTWSKNDPKQDDSKFHSTHLTYNDPKLNK